MNIIEKLSLYGVGVSLNDGNVTLSGLKEIPPTERPAVNALIESLKEQKNEVVKVLQRGAATPPPQEPKPRNIKPRLLSVGDELLLKVCKQQQEYIKQSDTVRCDINKGLNSGESLESLFLKAVKCISLMTGDTVVYTLAERQIKQQEAARCLM